jgi:hypothetical protein
MATAYITEYNSIGVQQGVAVPVAQEPAVANQAVTFTTAVQSSAFNAATKFIRFIADADCHLLFGENPTATASHQLITADTEIWRMVTPGQKVSVYDGTSS